VKIVARSISVEYDSGLPSARTALRGVDIALRLAECIAVIGPTGSGKTTLLEVLAGLRRPTAGVVVLEGGPRHRPLTSAVGLVYQFPELQLFEETVGADVAFGPVRQGISESEVEERVNDALRRVGLPPDEFASRAPPSLSAGERRRAAIAGILALDRPFLLLDEPTAGLDPGTREGIIDLIVQQVDAGRGVVVVTHDLELVDAVAVRTVVMSAGEIVLDSDTRSVMFDGEILDGLGFAPPPRYALVRTLRGKAPDVAERVESVLFGGALAERDVW